MKYEEFLGILGGNDSSSKYDKELEELRNKYAELEKKLNASLKSKEQALNEKDKELKNKEQVISALELTIASCQNDASKKKEAQDFCMAKISALLEKPGQEPLTVREYNKIFKLRKSINDERLKHNIASRMEHDITCLLGKYSYPNDKLGYLKLRGSLKQLRRYSVALKDVFNSYKLRALISEYESKLEEKRSEIAKAAPFYALTGATAAGLISAGIYFGGYMAAIDIGAAVGAVTQSTVGAIIDKLRGDDDIFIKAGAASGAITGAIGGAISYGNIPAFEKMPEIADLIARGSIGGAASCIAVCLLALGCVIAVESS